MNTRSSMVAAIAAMFVLALAVSALAFSQPTLTFQPVGPVGPSERVTGVYCSAVSTCVVSTEERFEGGHVYASDGKSITATLVTGDETFTEPLGVTGAANFMGFTSIGDRLFARVDGAADALLTATGDITQASSWQATTVGLPDGDASFAGNQQLGWGTADGRWVYAIRGTVYAGRDEPSPGALWIPAWSPTNVPGDLLQRHRDDPTLCLAQPSIGISPTPTRMAYVAPDLAVILYPTGARNQSGEEEPGVCISIDAGESFQHVPFPEVEGDLGPLGVTCSGSDLCVAFGGLQFAPESAYLYVTRNATAGASSTWTRAELPELREDSRFRDVSFAPDGMIGWAVGAEGAGSPLVLTTSDGGATWNDATSSVRVLAQGARLHAVYVVDEAHVWIGGENGVLLAGGYQTRPAASRLGSARPVALLSAHHS
ncbi:MAG TPA: hypothetical protein VFD39_14560 [Trueperaceae bacterium]|nr:hypothetical protein [Trueperaceae bacterium]